MQKLIISFLITLYVMQAFPQSTDGRGWYQSKDIENTEIGWVKLLQFTAPAKGHNGNGWSYPASQIGIAQQLTAWIQQTYSPKGLLGDIMPTVYAPPAPEPETSSSYTYNEAEKNNRNALPNTYGTQAKLYPNLRKTDTRKFWPIDGLANYYTWNIMANNIELISHQIITLSSPDEYYCIMPRQSNGMNDSPNLKNYIHYWIPSGALNNNEAFYAVIMTKDRQPLPLEHVTMGEFLERLEKQLPMLHKIAVNSGSRLDNMLEKAKHGLMLLKQKYEGRYHEQVYLSGNGQNITVIELANADANTSFYWLQTQPEVKDKYGNVTVGFPLLRLKKSVKEACATGGPQWLVFKLYNGSNHNHAGTAHLMDNFVNRFNYDYVYNYFFGNEKVTTPYQPK